MRDLERKIKKLEQRHMSNNTSREELQQYFDEEDLHPLERTSILIELGLLDIETVIGWIVQGSKNGE
jgi:hypothetical protein